jgi:hypothetical protein
MMDRKSGSNQLLAARAPEAGVAPPDPPATPGVAMTPVAQPRALVNHEAPPQAQAPAPRAPEQYRLDAGEETQLAIQPGRPPPRPPGGGSILGFLSRHLPRPLPPAVGVTTHAMEPMGATRAREAALAREHAQSRMIPIPDTADDALQLGMPTHRVRGKSRDPRAALPQGPVMDEPAAVRAIRDDSHVAPMQLANPPTAPLGPSMEAIVAPPPLTQYGTRAPSKDFGPTTRNHGPPMAGAAREESPMIVSLQPPAKLPQGPVSVMPGFMRMLPGGNPKALSPFDSNDDLPPDRVADLAGMSWRGLGAAARFARTAAVDYVAPAIGAGGQLALDHIIKPAGQHALEHAKGALSIRAGREV